MKIKTSFSPKYYADTPTASMRKLPLVAKAVEKLGYAELIAPDTLDVSKLRKLHDPVYVDAFLSGTGLLATSQGWPWSEQIRDGVLAIQSGQLLAARLAFEHKIAANIAQGFHHARPSQGGGFCTFNGLALVAQEYPDKKIFVLDCDEHGGNGTEAFTARLANLFNFTICGSIYGCQGAQRSICRPLPAITYNFQLYLNALQDGFTAVQKWQPDLIIYQAGADPHIDDPLGSLGMTTEQMLLRDRTVFEFCAKSEIPTFFVLAGGYQEPMEDCLVPLHVNTFRAAFETWKAKS